MIDPSDFFVAGGTLRAQAPSYVTRPADGDLLNHLLKGEFCYVLTARQMGKSSLMVRTAQRLQEQGVQTAIIDLTSIGTVPQEEWYLGLLSRLRSGLRLSEVDVQAWWQTHAQLSVAQRFSNFLRDVVLDTIQARVVIFIDEIDATLGLTFRDDFFAAIRAIYNARANEPVYNRLTFSLFGVATPTDLIQDRERTPFNIGQRIDLQEFTYADAEPLHTGLDDIHQGQGEAILQRVFFWTNGHPYLTQKLCAVIANQATEAWDDAAIDQIVEKSFLSDEGRKDTNLTFVQDRVAASPEAERRAMLTLYRQVQQSKRIKDDDRSPVQNRLELYGLLRVEENHLQVRNALYRQVFSAEWVQANMPINTQRRRAMLAVGAMLLIVVGVVAYIFNQPNQTCDTYTKQFGQTKESTLRIDALAGLFNANCRKEAITLFYGLSPYEQEELFLDTKNVQISSLNTTIKGIYVTLDTMPEPDRYDLKLMATMLEAMKEAGMRTDDPLIVQISAWLKGREQARSKNYQDAVDSYEVAIALYPDHPVIHFDRAEAYINLSRYDSALNELDEVIRIAQVIRLTPTPIETITPALAASLLFESTFSQTSTSALSKTPIIKPVPFQITATSTSLTSTFPLKSIVYSQRFFDSNKIIETIQNKIQGNSEILAYWQENSLSYPKLRYLLVTPVVYSGLQLSIAIDPHNILEKNLSGQTHHAEVAGAILELISGNVVTRNIDLLSVYSFRADGGLQTIQEWTKEPNLIFNSTVQSKLEDINDNASLTEPLLQILDKFQTQAESTQLTRSLLLFSTGTSLLDPDRVAVKANGLNIRIYTVQMGNREQTDKLDSTLRILAQQTRGAYIILSNSNITSILSLLRQRIVR